MTEDIFYYILADTTVGGVAESCLPAGRPVYREVEVECSMFYIYFLRSQKDSGLYIGRTNNVARRLSEHNGGQVPSTMSRRPFILLGFDSCATEAESVMLEKEWKKGFKRQELKKRFSL